MHGAWGEYYGLSCERCRLESGMANVCPRIHLCTQKGHLGWYEKRKEEKRKGVTYINIGDMEPSDGTIDAPPPVENPHNTLSSISSPTSGKPTQDHVFVLT